MNTRAHWGSRLGFIMAATGSAVGLGNIWGFPYKTGQNGGGWFVLAYLLCVLLVGLPIMMAELLVGRTTQQSTLGALRTVTRPGSPWLATGWLGILTAFVILSFYSVIAGWTLHYIYLAFSGELTGINIDDATELFGGVATSPITSIGWHVVFMILTVGIVAGGIQNGLERFTKIMMPLLFFVLVAMVVRALVGGGFNQTFNYVFLGEGGASFRPSSVAAAMGQAFFSLSLGMGAMITYGSYLRQDEDVVSTSIIVTGLDTGVALLACFALFPILFATGMEPSGGPGLVFQSAAASLGGLPLSWLWCGMFFILLLFAALTSSIALLEVVVAYLVDEWKIPRAASAMIMGLVVACAGVPSALSGSGYFNEGFKEQSAGFYEAIDVGQEVDIPESEREAGLDAPTKRTEYGKNWMDTMVFITDNTLSLGGLLIALLLAWRIKENVRRAEFLKGTKFGQLYVGWLLLLRIVVPLAIILVLLTGFNILRL